MPETKRSEYAPVNLPSVPANPENWSESSKRATIYSYLVEYQDIHF